MCYTGSAMKIYTILDKDFRKSGLLLRLTKTQVEFPFFEFFHNRSPYQCLPNYAEFFCFVLFVVIKKNWRTWFFETCRHSLT